MSNQHLGEGDVPDAPELWLEFDKTSGVVGVHVTDREGHYSVAVDAKPAALDAMAEGMAQLLEL